MKIKVIIILVSLCFLSCSDNLEDQVKKYQGEGQIKYVESFGVFGSSGVIIDFPIFELKNDFSETYDISTLPEAKAYHVYFKTKEVDPIELSPQGILSYVLFKNGKIVSKFTSPIKEMRLASGGGDDKLYFYIQNKGSIHFDVAESNTQWKITITCKNALNEGKKSGLGYFRIEKTGGK
ncbi:MAG: hypothetical protein L3J69_07140 [Desulfobacula sp.]|nr:hypothetical protein [Desulfobacula sp.]